MLQKQIIHFLLLFRRQAHLLSEGWLPPPASGEAGLQRSLHRLSRSRLLSCCAADPHHGEAHYPKPEPHRGSPGVACSTGIRLISRKRLHERLQNLGNCARHICSDAVKQQLVLSIDRV